MTVALSDNSQDRLRDTIWAATSQALLVEPRILRRVIRLDQRLAGLGLSVPHSMAYVIERARLLAYVELEELGLAPTDELPRDVILLARLADEDLPTTRTLSESLARYQRHLFHAQVHLHLEQRLRQFELAEEHVRGRRHQIGEVEFQEIRAVLLKDGQLFADSSEVETYVEFVAVYLELRYFAADQLPWCFPAIQDWSAIERMVAEEIDHVPLFVEVAQLSAVPIDLPAASAAGDAGSDGRAARPSPLWRIRKRNLPARARRAAAIGNGVKAAILRALDTPAGPSSTGAPSPAAVRELEQVVLRLQPVLRLSDEEVREWTQALEPLLLPAASEIWTVEARLLYDLQKACVEHERGVFRFDLLRWCWTLGRTPLRRPLPLLREVLITKHLRSATRRLSSARLQPAQRERLSRLVAAASQHAEERVRESIRPLALQVLDRSGLVPRNVPERVARLNVVEELLDVIVEQGVANLGHLRDAISRNDIKLPDLAGAIQLMRGDALLLADRQLANILTGVYRPGALYLRSTQRLSSIAFGTGTGRFLTRYVALPFGGAFLVLEGIRHLLSALSGHHLEADRADLLVPAAPAATGTDLATVLALGSLLLLLIHSPPFRRWCWGALGSIWNVLRTALVELPSRILRSPIVQDFLRGPAFAALRSYLIWPGITTLVARALSNWISRPISSHLTFDLFLVTALFLNSRVGRYLDERIGDLLLRTWHELRMRVFAALFEWIMDMFHRLFAYLERFVYTVDEWLRFRAGDNRMVESVKLLSGTCWFFISYFVILAFTLLIEPQVNPIKHFPVVTVSHKLLLPAGPAIVESLAPLIGTTRATTLVWSTIWLIPGVFGFLVWELKENWRLYAANRAATLVRTPVGHHGETMVRLLRPGFHSGTLPKLFASLRAALRDAQEHEERKPLERKLAALRRVEESIHRFVDRKLLTLWAESGQMAACPLAIQHVRLATTRIEVATELADPPHCTLQLIWQEQHGQLIASADTDLSTEQLDPVTGEALATAISGLFQRSCADVIELPDPLPERPLMDWREWVRTWNAVQGFSEQSPEVRTCDLTPLPAHGAE